MTLIKIIVFVFILFVIYYHYFLYVDVKNHCYIKIRPSIHLEFSNLTIKKALKVLKFASPEDYQRVCRYVDTIDTNISCGGFGGGCYTYYREPKTIYVSTSQRDLIMTVGVIIHETCHAIQYYENRSFEETECYESSDKILKKIVEF